MLTACAGGAGPDRLFAYRDGALAGRASATSTATCASLAAWTCPPRTSAPGTPPCWWPRSWPPPTSRATPSASRQRAVQGGGRRGRGVPRQHPDDRARTPTSTRGSSTSTRAAPRSTPTWSRKKYRSPAATPARPRGGRARPAQLRASAQRRERAATHSTVRTPFQRGPPLLRTASQRCLRAGSVAVEPVVQRHVHHCR